MKQEDKSPYYHGTNITLEALLKIMPTINVDGTTYQLKDWLKECGVPLSEHGTACGWSNANLTIFPWEQTIPAFTTNIEKALRYENRNTPQRFINLNSRLKISIT